MLIIRFFTVSIIVFSIFLQSCGGSSDYGKFGKVEMGMSEEEVVEILGDPNRNFEYQSERGYVRILEYKKGETAIEIFLLNGRVSKADGSFAR
jgi:outer membrane protein assembly factor BamE (lipoprotein component of BamABCDE complex)